MIEWINKELDEKERVLFKKVRQEDIVLNPSLMSLCKDNQCGQYGTNWMCPPGVGTYEEVTEELRSCGDGFLMQMIHPLEDSYDIEGWKRAFKDFDDRLNKVVMDLEEHIAKEELLCLGGGPCRVCEVCTMKSGDACRYPNQAIASVEAYGIEVSSTVANVGLDYNNGPNTMSTVAIILRRNR
jgi:predicted metal-binding protein